MTTTTEVSDSLERVDSIVNMLDEICDHMDGFSQVCPSFCTKPRAPVRTTCWVSAFVSATPTTRYPHGPTFTVGSSGLAEPRLEDPPWQGSH